MDDEAGVDELAEQVVGRRAGEPELPGQGGGRNRTRLTSERLQQPEGVPGRRNARHRASWARIASTTRRWSSSWGRPETTTTPTGPTDRTKIGKPPPWAAYSWGSSPRASSNVVPRSMNICRT